MQRSQSSNGLRLMRIERIPERVYMKWFVKEPKSNATPEEYDEWLDWEEFKTIAGLLIIFAIYLWSYFRE